MCHFSIVQGVLLLRQMSKTLFEKKVMNSLAEAELLMMLSSGRMMSLCLQKAVSQKCIFIAEDILFHILFSVVVGKTGKQQFWMSKVKGNAHHLM